MDEIREYYKKLEDDGYITSEGKPIKCQHCENTSFVYQNESYESVWLVEYTLVCDKCYNFAGHWAYGYWQID